MVSILDPSGNPLAIHRVENPMAVPTSTVRLGASAVASTRRNRPTAGLTIGMLSARPDCSISLRTSVSCGWTDSRYSRSRSANGVAGPPREMVQGAVAVTQLGGVRECRREILARLAYGGAQVRARGQARGDCRRKCAARPMGAGGRNPRGPEFLDAVDVDE